MGKHQAVTCGPGVGEWVALRLRGRLSPGPPRRSGASGGAGRQGARRRPRGTAVAPPTPCLRTPAAAVGDTTAVGVVIAVVTVASFLPTRPVSVCRHLRDVALFRLLPLVLVLASSSPQVLRDQATGAAVVAGALRPHAGALEVALIVRCFPLFLPPLLVFIPRRRRCPLAVLPWFSFLLVVGGGSQVRVSLSCTATLSLRRSASEWQ